MKKSIQNDFEGYSEWLDEIQQSFFLNLEAELNAMAKNSEVNRNADDRF